MPKRKKTPEAKFVEALAELFTPDQLSRIMYALVSMQTLAKLKEKANEPKQWDSSQQAGGKP